MDGCTQAKEIVWRHVKMTKATFDSNYKYRETYSLINIKSVAEKDEFSVQT